MKVFKIARRESYISPIWREFFVAMHESTHEGEFNRKNYNIFNAMHESTHVDKLNLYVFDHDKRGCIDAQKMVGYSKLKIKGTTAHLDEMFLLREYRGLKLGQKMLDIRTEYADESGCDKLTVSLLEDKHIENRRRFFMRNGFTFKDIQWGEKPIGELDPNVKHLPNPRAIMDIPLDEYKLYGQADEIYWQYLEDTRREQKEM